MLRPEKRKIFIYYDLAEDVNLARNKPTAKKRRLVKAGQRAKPVPAWVMAKTRGRVRRHAKRRHWRRSKIKA
jgi:large subunit ribosomal protein L39e